MDTGFVANRPARKVMLELLDWNMPAEMLVGVDNALIESNNFFLAKMGIPLEYCLLHLTVLYH